MKIMSGKTGAPHVTSQQFRQLVEGTVGQGSYILNSGENLEAELSSNNLLKIRSGIMSHHGNLSIVDIGTYDEVTIQNGTQGMKRIDLIVNRYTKNDETGIEENEWVVIMGTPDAESPVAPAYTEGNLQEGDLVDDCPVFEVHLDGINVTEVVNLLSISPDIPTLNASLSDLTNKIKIVDILQCDITYGDDFVIEGGSYHTCTGTIKSDKKISDCKFKAFFICSNYGVPMSDPTFLVRGDYDVTVQQPVRNYTSINHSVITTIGVICYK